MEHGYSVGGYITTPRSWCSHNDAQFGFLLLPLVVGFITARIHSCEKVVFSQAVCPSIHRGAGRVVSPKIASEFFPVTDPTKITATTTQRAHNQYTNCLLVSDSPHLYCP